MEEQFDMRQFGIEPATCMDILDGETVGASLKKAREHLGLILADITAATRIREPQLMALEQNRFGAFPSPIYAIGFARAYARVVGICESDIADRLREEMGVSVVA